MSANAENLGFDLEHAKAKKRKYRLYGIRIPFALGFILSFVIMLPHLSEGKEFLVGSILGGIFFGLAFGVIGFVISEIVRSFSIEQRTLDAVKVPSVSKGIRGDDISSLIGISIAIGLGVTIVAWLIWQDWFNSNSNSFWLVWGVIAVVTLPVSYASVKSKTTCPNCHKSFSLTDTAQQTIESYVKYRNQRLRENGIDYIKDVPYNCRRYWQFTKCDKCGYEFKTEKTEENRA